MEREDGGDGFFYCDRVGDNVNVHFHHSTTSSLSMLRALPSIFLYSIPIFLNTLDDVCVRHKALYVDINKLDSK